MQAEGTCLKTTVEAEVLPFKPQSLTEAAILVDSDLYSQSLQELRC